MERAIYASLLPVMALMALVVGLACLIFAAPPLAWALWAFMVAAISLGAIGYWRS